MVTHNPPIFVEEDEKGERYTCREADLDKRRADETLARKETVETVRGKAREKRIEATRCTDAPMHRVLHIRSTTSIGSVAIKVKLPIQSGP